MINLFIFSDVLSKICIPIWKMGTRKDYIINRYGSSLKDIKRWRNRDDGFTPGSLIYNKGNGKRSGKL